MRAPHQTPKMKTFKLLVDLTVWPDVEECSFLLLVIPKGTMIYETYDGGVYETHKPDPVMRVGCNWVDKNLHVFQEVIEK